MSNTSQTDAAGARRRSAGACFAVIAAFPLALLVTIASLGGVLAPGTYAAETASLAAQGIGQDAVNLLVAVPWLVLCAIQALRGSRRALPLLGAGYAYVAYSYAVYAFGIHFNQLFLVYVAALGLSGFALAALLARLVREDVRGWFAARGREWPAAVVQIAIAAVFAALWLSEVVPAVAAGTTPPSVADYGLLTNPVHVLDLALVLPALVVAAVALLRRRPLGYVLTPVLLGLAMLMAVAIGGMVIAVVVRDVAEDFTVALVFAAVAGLCAATLATMLRRVPPLAGA
jgi:hypothetical protein